MRDMNLHSMKKMLGIGVILALGFLLVVFAFQEGDGIVSTKNFPYLAQTAEQAVPATVQMYYYNPENDRDSNGNLLCSAAGLMPVERTITSGRLIEDTIGLLLKGELTTQELQQGIVTEFPLAGLKLRKSDLSDGVLTLMFDDPNRRTNGGSCRIAVLWAQIEATAKQFPGVAQVRFLPKYLFQP